MRQAQFLGQQVECRIARRRVLLGALKMVLRSSQRLHVARAGDEQALGRGLPAGLPQQGLAQRVQAGTGARRQRQRAGGAPGRSVLL